MITTAGFNYVSFFNKYIVQAAEERRRRLESDQMMSLAEKQKKAEEVRAKKASIVETNETAA